MAKLMNLQEWASATYSQPPSLSTLRRWVREGRIYPCPALHGKEYKLEPNSAYVDPCKKRMKRRPEYVAPPKKGSLMEKLKQAAEGMGGWLQSAMNIGLLTAQRREDVTRM